MNRFCERLTTNDEIVVQINDMFRLREVSIGNICRLYFFRLTCTYCSRIYEARNPLRELCFIIRRSLLMRTEYKSFYNMYSYIRVLWEMIFQDFVTAMKSESGEWRDQTNTKLLMYNWVRFFFFKRLCWHLPKIMQIICLCKVTRTFPQKLAKE